MATNGASTTSQQLMPIFNGHKYEFLSIKMKTLFKFQELWDLVEKGYAVEDEAQRLRENKKKDSKALNIKQAWDILKKEFHGSTMTYGDKITDETIVSKVLRSLNKRFDHVVAATEESRDLSNYGFDESMSSLQAHKDRLNASQEKGEEKAFQIKGESSFKGKSEVSNARGFGGTGSFRGRGHGRGRAQFGGEHRQFKSNIQCRYCRKMGHKEAD
ncbi:hypothetical protein KY290_037019 [Solanum tuberosum]|uniref:Uncharacterized protein n=1 Tax=Solanum tuberosum TaxID=4113 RepID=A0ABQ7TVN9_SOLTU|nr:hypothetical protein KY289_036511 [Solanum tuberosum]KAH0738314.1 hypothetical protein KY290_037019 [Solanum tuberosum]